MKVTTSFGTVKIVMLKGEKGDKFEFEDYTPEELESLRGEKGDPFTYDDFTEEQLTDLRSSVASAYYRKIDATYRTISDNTETIPIPIEGYTSADMLFVDVEGLALTEGVDYTIDGDNIVLATPITHNYTAVNFRAIRAFAITTEDYDSLIGDLTTDMSIYIDEWMAEHPEATTTVQDGSITNAKLAQSGGILSEVVDIRTGADGKTYSAAGNAVRGQVNDLENGLHYVGANAHKGSIVFYTDDTEFTYQGYLNGNGNPQLNAGFRTSDYISLGDYTHIDMIATTMDNLSNIVFYDSDGTRISKYTGSGEATITEISVDIPYNAVYARFSKLATDDVNIKFISSPMARKLWLAIGDSITVGMGNDGISYADYAADILGIAVNKQAVSGQTMSAIYGKANNGDYDSIDADIITVLAGTNDWNISKKAKNSDIDTVWTANTYLAFVNSFIEIMQAKFPNAQIVFLSCLQRNYFGSGADNVSGVTNSLGESLETYRDALIIGCRYHGVPVIDLYSEAGICALNLLPNESGYSTSNIAAYTVDGLHPNELGHKRIATIVAEKLKAYI